MREFGPNSRNPRARRAFAHAQISRARAGEVPLHVAFQAVTAAMKTRKGENSGLDGALFNSMPPRKEYVPQPSPGEIAFKPLLAAFRERQPLSPSDQQALVVRSLDALILDSALQLDNSDLPSSQRPRIYSEIQACAEQLVALGVRPDMHVGEPRESIESDALRLAEYAGGQMLTCLGVDMPHGEVTSETSSSHVEIDVRGISLITGTAGAANKCIAPWLG